MIVEVPRWTNAKMEVIEKIPWLDKYLWKLWQCSGFQSSEFDQSVNYSLHVNFSLLKNEFEVVHTDNFLAITKNVEVLI